VAAHLVAGTQMQNFGNILPKGFDVIVVEIKPPADGKPLVGDGRGAGPDVDAVGGPVAEIIHGPVLQARACTDHDQQ